MAAEARAYPESVPELWAKTSDAGRHAIAEAVFERIDVLGVTDYTFTLTARAGAHGWMRPSAAESSARKKVDLVGARGLAPIEITSSAGTRVYHCAPECEVLAVAVNEIRREASAGR